MPPHSAPVDRAARDRHDHQLLIRYRRNGDSHARELLAERWMGIGDRLAQRYRRVGEAHADELTCVAALAVAQAIDRYDLSRPTSFASFAVPTIIGALRHHVRDYSWTLRVSRPLQERAQAMRTLVPVLTQTLGRSPTTREIADELGCAVEDVLEAVDVQAASSVRSMSLPLSVDGEDGRTLEEVHGADDAGFSCVDERDALEDAKRVLTVRQQRAIDLYFHQGLSQREIAPLLGISQMQVSRVLRQALAAMREAYALSPDESTDRSASTAASLSRR